VVNLAKKLIMKLAQQAGWEPILSSAHHKYNKPGAFVKRLPSDQRKVLEQLQSEDIRDIRL